MLIYERNLNSSVSKAEDGTITIRASLLDLNHNMWLEITVDPATRTITAARGDIIKAPLTVCRNTLERIQGLVTLRLERGINRGLVGALGGPCGCTHLYELALACVRLGFNVIIGMEFNWDEWITRSVPEDRFIEMARPHLRNSCLPFKDAPAPSGAPDGKPTVPGDKR